MANKAYYRFELASSGKSHDEGFLQGLEAAPIPFPVIDELYRAFDSLPVPPILETVDDSAVVFLFTEKGLRNFAGPINDIIYKLSSCNWQVIGMAAELDPQFALYEDDYQIAFSRTELIEMLFPQNMDYRIVTNISFEEDKSPIHYISSAKPSLDTFIETARSKIQNQGPDKKSHCQDFDRFSNRFSI